MKKRSHRWHFDFTERARKQLRTLSSADRMRVFRSIAELLKADDPGLVPGVKAVKGREDVFRQRQGDYRIFFTLETGEIVVMGFTYKGTCYILAVEKHHEGY